MPLIIKSFMGVFFFSLIVFLGIGIINYQTDVSRAVCYKQDVIAELQNSDYSPSVINACIAAGAKNGYEVSVDVSFEDGSCRAYNKNHMASDTAGVASAYVTVNYTSRLPFLGIESLNSLNGFAR